MRRDLMPNGKVLSEIGVWLWTNGLYWIMDMIQGSIVRCYEGAVVHSVCRQDLGDALDDETSARLSARLRQARLTRKMTLKVLARAARCSESLLSKIENGKAYPSLPMLDRLVKALDIGMGWMFDDHDGDEPIIFRAERHAAALARRVVTVEQVIPESDRHALRCSFFHIEAGVTSNGEDQHIGEEVGYLVDGRLELLIAGGAYRLDVGDAFAFHSYQPHTYRNFGISRATLLWVSIARVI